MTLSGGPTGTSTARRAGWESMRRDLRGGKGRQPPSCVEVGKAVIGRQTSNSASVAEAGVTMPQDYGSANSRPSCLDRSSEASLAKVYQFRLLPRWLYIPECSLLERRGSTSKIPVGHQILQTLHSFRRLAQPTCRLGTSTQSAYDRYVQNAQNPGPTPGWTGTHKGCRLQGYHGMGRVSYSLPRVFRSLVIVSQPFVSPDPRARKSKRYSRDRGGRPVHSTLEQDSPL